MQNKCFRWDEGKSSRARIRAISQGTSFSHGNIIHSTLPHAGYDDNRLSYINSTVESTVHCSEHNRDF